MKLLALFALLAVAFAAPAEEAEAAPETPETSELRVTQTGCSCVGWPFDNWIMKPQAAGNPNGFCWINGNMIQRDRDFVRNAILRNADTRWVNGIQGNNWCRSRRIRPRSQQCANRIINEHTRTQGNALLSLCTYPIAGRFEPTTCDCEFRCTGRWERCGRHCVRRGTQCNGGIPVERQCEPGQELCGDECVPRGTRCVNGVPIQPRAAQDKC